MRQRQGKKSPLAKKPVVLFLVFFLFFTDVLLFADSRPKILFLPLLPKGNATQEVSDQTTARLASELKKLDLFDLSISPNWLRELKLDEYTYFYNTEFQKRIASLGFFDFILSGYISQDPSNGEYELLLVITNFKSRNLEYNKGYLGMQNLDGLIKSHVEAIKKHKIFIPDQAVVREKYFELLKKHSPATFPIIDRLRQRNDSFDILVFVLADNSLVLGMETAVHEGTHVVTRTPGRAKEYAYYINPGETIVVPITETFPSKELVAVIPENLRTFRFKTYIEAPISDTATQSEGIYGLLDEFNAYYQGLFAACDLFPYYKENIFSPNFMTYFEFLRAVYADYFAYYEFKFFIETYLIYAQKKYPAAYGKIMGNRNFISVFRKLDAAWIGLLERIRDLEKEMNALVEKYGMAITREGNWTYIGPKGSRGFSMENNQDAIDLLSYQMAKEEYLKLETTLFQK